MTHIKFGIALLGKTLELIRGRRWSVVSGPRPILAKSYTRKFLHCFVQCIYIYYIFNLRKAPPAIEIFCKSYVLPRYLSSIESILMHEIWLRSAQGWLHIKVLHSNLLHCTFFTFLHCCKSTRNMKLFLAQFYFRNNSIINCCCYFWFNRSCWSFDANSRKLSPIINIKQ